MNKCIIILIVIILILYIIFANIKTKEEFCEGDEDSVNNGYQNVLDKSTRKEISNMIYDKIMNVLNNGKTFIPGPKGERGVRGPAGAKYEKHGRLVNKLASCKEVTDNDGKKTYDCSNPNLVCYKNLKFVKPNIDSSFYWYITDDNKIKNKYDNKCLGYFPTNTDGKPLKLTSCNIDDPGVKLNWEWNDNNQLVTGGDNCLTVIQTKQDEKVMSIEKCSGVSGANRGEINNGLKTEQIWSFI